MRRIPHDTLKKVSVVAAIVAFILLSWWLLDRYKYYRQGCVEYTYRHVVDEYAEEGLAKVRALQICRERALVGSSAVVISGGNAMTTRNPTKNTAELFQEIDPIAEESAPTDR